MVHQNRERVPDVNDSKFVVRQLLFAEEPHFGKKSEKMPRAKQEIDKQDGIQTDKEEAKKKRKKREEERKRTAKEVEIHHDVPEADRHCPNCSEQDLKKAGSKSSVPIEWVPGHFERQTHAPEEAKYILDQILNLYRVEYEAVKRAITGKPIHQQLRVEKVILAKKQSMVIFLKSMPKASFLNSIFILGNIL